MATIDRTADSKGTLGDPKVVTKTLDCNVDNLAQNDIAQLIDVPANTYVLMVRWEVETVEGGARNFAIGDGSDTDGFVPTTSANSLASGAMALALAEAAPNTVGGYTNGKYYAAADTIDLLAVTADGLTGAKITVSALMVTM